MDDEDNKLELPPEKVSRVMTLRITKTQHEAMKLRAAMLRMSMNQWIVNSLFTLMDPMILREDNLVKEFKEEFGLELEVLEKKTS